MEKGLFIVIEGMDGSGKGTQVDRLKKFLSTLDVKCVFTREPGGTCISEEIRNILLDKNNKGIMFDITEALLFAAARAQHIREFIVPNLINGKHVISDRFVDSSLVYQGYARKLGIDNVRKINDYAIRDIEVEVENNGQKNYVKIEKIEPDLTICLLLNPKVCMQRIMKRGSNENLDRIELEGEEFQRNVHDGFLEIKKMRGNKMVIVDASRDVDTVHEEIKEKIVKVLKRK